MLLPLYYVRKTDFPKNLIRFPERSNICPSDNEPPVRYRISTRRGATIATLFTVAFDLTATGGGAAIVVHTGISDGAAVFPFSSSGDITPGAG